MSINRIDKPYRELISDIISALGGDKALNYIPALNSNDLHIKALAEIANSHLNGWSGWKPLF